MFEREWFWACLEGQLSTDLRSHRCCLPEVPKLIALTPHPCQHPTKSNFDKGISGQLGLSKSPFSFHLGQQAGLVGRRKQKEENRSLS